MNEREKLNEMITLTGITLYEVIDMEKSAEFALLGSCDIDTCDLFWHTCHNCDYHLEDTGECLNCDYS
jgi:hypothetical protein